MLSAGFGVLALTALAILCPRVRIGSPAHRALRRGVMALGALWALSLLPGFRVGVNALTVSCAALLGLPGVAVMQAIALMGGM